MKKINSWNSEMGLKCKYS